MTTSMGEGLAMLIARYAKIVMSLALAAFCLLVAFDNLTDYGTNYLFVQHVLSMDTTFPGNALMYRLDHQSRAVADRLRADHRRRGRDRHSVSRRRHSPGPGAERAAARSSTQAKALVVAGATLAFLVWFFGFMVVAGEWFAMWQSQTWNGQEAAFRFYMAVLGVLIFVALPDGDLDGAPLAPRPLSAAVPTRSKPRRG